MPRRQRELQTMYNEGGSMQTAFQVILGKYFLLFSHPKFWQTYSVHQNPPPHPPAAAPPMKKCRATKKKSTTVPAVGEGAASSPTTPCQGQAASDPMHQTQPASILVPVVELLPIIETAPEQPRRHSPFHISLCSSDFLLFSMPEVRSSSAPQTVDDVFSNASVAQGMQSPNHALRRPVHAERGERATRGLNRCVNHT